MEVLELFTALESNHPQEVEDVKHKFHEQFNIIREPWLLNGMYDYFISTGSQRAVEVLVAVREPHDRFLFDRLGDGLKSSSRLQALTLLGHVVKRQPTWLIKITNHHLLKELIKILKLENEIITITSALLVINVLLTVIPALISSFLPEIFEGFSRLAAWNTSQKNRVPEIHLFHLQISLYVLFVQLYSMYPCSFILYLKQEYSSHNQQTNHLVFTHTIKPMIETMRMHPSLIVSSKDVETSTNRWKKMEQHDVVMECTRYTLMENGDKNYQSSSTWTNTGSSFSSALEVLKSSIGATEDIISVNSIRNKELWSPMLCCREFFNDSVKSIPTTPNLQTYYKTSIFNHNENSPPEAAVEATPETTPIRDVLYQQSRIPPINSTVVRALNSFGLENLSRRNSSTPNSQPSSPLKKEGFIFPSEDIQSQALVRRMDRMMLERNQAADLNKDESNIRSESKPIATQIQLMNNPEIVQTGDEDMIECDQQSNGSPCQTYEGGLHMPDSASFKEFVKTVRTRRRYHSQCTPEKNINIIGQSTGSSPRKGSEFSLLNVRRANSCPEIKKTNGSSISSGTSPLQEESEEDHGDTTNIINDRNSEIPKNKGKKDNHATKIQTVSTQTEPILPYEHLFYSIFPAYNDPHNSQQSVPNSEVDESLCVIEKYVRTSAIVLNHRHTAESCDDVKLLRDQITLLTLQLQFERNRREVHAERNRRLLGKSRSSRALDEHNSALKDQVSMLQIELENITSGFEIFRRKSSSQIEELKESVSHWRAESSKYQEETKEAKLNCLTLEQLYNGERVKTADVTKQLSETKAELFNTLSELSIAQGAADISKELNKTVTNLQRELVMCGEMQSRQRDVVTHVNTLRRDATNAMLSQESYKHHLNELQDKLFLKSAQLDASNARVAELELKLSNKNASIYNEKREIEIIKEQFNKQLSGIKEECRILKELHCRYQENELEKNSKKYCQCQESKLEDNSKMEFIDRLPKYNVDMASNTSISDEGADFRLHMMMAMNDDSENHHETTILK